MNLSSESSSGRIPVELHPMCDETSMIATAALEKGCNVILRMLRGRQTGQGIYAVPRTGKTHLIDYFIQLHPDFMGTQFPVLNSKCGRQWVHHRQQKPVSTLSYCGY